MAPQIVDGNFEGHHLNEGLKNSLLLGVKEVQSTPLSNHHQAKLSVTSIKHLPIWITGLSFISQAIYDTVTFKESKNLPEPALQTEHQHKGRYSDLRTPHFL